MLDGPSDAAQHATQELPLPGTTKIARVVQPKRRGRKVVVDEASQRVDGTASNATELDAGERIAQPFVVPGSGNS